MKSTVIVLVIIFAFLQYKIWFDESGVKEVGQLTAKLASEKNRFKDRVAHNQHMVKHINDLKHDEEMVEHHARKDLGMTKRNESYYQIIEK